MSDTVENNTDMMSSPDGPSGYDSSNKLHEFNSGEQLSEQPPTESVTQKGGRKSKAKKEGKKKEKKQSSKKEKKQSSKKEKKPNKWLIHVKTVKDANPTMSYKEVLVKAKETYKK
jgi:hypothetical protein